MVMHEKSVSGSRKGRSVRSLNSHPTRMMDMMDNMEEDEEEHSRRITSRGSKVEQRGFDRYLEAFPDIRNIQTYLVEEATKAKIPIVETSERSKAIIKMMDIIWDRILMLDEKGKE